MPIRLRKDIGAQIKAAREAKEMTQRDMAQKLGVHEATYCRFESEPFKSRAATIIPALVILGLTDLDELSTKD